MRKNKLENKSLFESTHINESINRLNTMDTKSQNLSSVDLERMARDWVRECNRLEKKLTKAKRELEKVRNHIKSKETPGIRFLKNHGYKDMWIGEEENKKRFLLSSVALQPATERSRAIKAVGKYLGSAWDTMNSWMQRNMQAYLEGKDEECLGWE